MKTIIHLPACSNTWCLLAISLVFTFSAAAQDVHYRDPQNPGKGHWLLFTDPATLSTSIKFFDANKHLLYEEVLPKKYIKLTDRNINKINQTFDLITANNLVSTKVKSNPLSPVVNSRAFSRRNPAHRDASQTRHASPDVAGSAIKLNTFKVANSTKFHIAFQNPDRKRVKIHLLNEAGQMLYAEYVNGANYKRKLDLVGLHTGKYTLVVTTVDRKYRFTEQIIIGPSTRTLEIKQTIPALLTSSKPSY